MSFLENAATLDEALAFIDSCSEHSSNAGSGGDSSPARSCSSPDVEPAQAPQASDANEKEKKRRASGYSMKVQRRKKQELATLRDQAKVLEAELGRWKQLQSATQPQANALTSGPHQAPATAKQDWHRTAIVQLQERQRAEKTNRKLLELLKKKARVNDAVRRVLQKSSTIPVRRLFRSCYRVLILTSVFRAGLGGNPGQSSPYRSPPTRGAGPQPRASLTTGRRRGKHASRLRLHVGADRAAVR
jgi:hypothetical protein